MSTLNKRLNFRDDLVQKSNRQLRDIAHAAWDRLIQSELLQTPSNYALWFHALSNTVDGLLEAMNGLMQASPLAQPGELEAIRARFLPKLLKNDEFDSLFPLDIEFEKRRASDFPKIYQTSGVAADIMDAAGAALTQANRINSGYAETLAELHPANIATPSDFRTAIQRLTEKTHGVIVENLGLRKELESFSSRMKALKEELENTQSELSRAQTSLSEARLAAETDALTQLPNRRSFEQDLSVLLSAIEKPFCLVLTDIDFFKSFNDQHGHAMGDQVLKLVAQSLAQSVKSVGKAYRFGGEEFALILQNQPITKVFMICETIRQTVAGREIVNRKTSQSLGRITLSAGITLAQAGESMERIINRADQALYTAKNQGRNQVICTPLTSNCPA